MPPLSEFIFLFIDPAESDTLKKLLEVHEAILTTAESTFAATIETKELLTSKIGKIDASKLSANFVYRLPTVVCCPEELLSCPDSQLSAVCDAVSTFANGILSLDRPKGIDEKKNIQQLSQVMLESIAKVLLHRLDTDIVPEVPF